MNSPQAKFILQGYRPDGADAADERFAEALAHARQDMELGQWLAKSTAFDRAISGKLAEITPPAGLREAILAGGRLTAIPDEPTGFKRWWRQPAWVTAAASIALIGVLSFTFWPQAGAGSATLGEFAVADAKSLHGHAHHGKMVADFQAKLSLPTTAVGRLAGIDFAALRDTGCRTVRFQGREVLEFCFERNGAWFHCYIARREDFPTMAASLAPTLIEHGKATIASWSDALHLYVVVGQGRASLESIL